VRNRLSLLVLALWLTVSTTTAALASPLTTERVGATSAPTASASTTETGRPEAVRSSGSRSALGGDSPAAPTAPRAEAEAEGGLSAARTQLVAGGVVPLPAHRIVDTRVGQGAPKAPVAAGSSIVVDVTGREGIPEGTRTVALTVTAVQPSASGWVTVHAHGSTRPTASALNYAPGQTVPNLVIAQASVDGLVDLHVGGSGTVQLLVDVAGYVEPGASTSPGTMTSVAPARLLDTRSGVGAPSGPVTGGAKRTVAIAGRGGVPVGSAASVVLNLTVTGATASGYATAAPVLSGSEPATTSSLNWVKAQTRANLVVVPLSSAGAFDLRVTSSGSVHLIADVVGWVRDGVPAVDGGMAAVAPSRILDTRGDPEGPLADGEWVTVRVAGYDGVPVSGVSAVLVNATATAATASGWVGALPSGPNLPTGSNLNFTPGRSDANLVLVPVSRDGYIDLLVATPGTVHLVADVAGFVLGEPADTTAPQAVSYVKVTQPARNSITLTWTNPTDEDFAEVMIRRVTEGDASLDPTEGTLVARTSGTTFTDTGLTPGTRYSYSIWALDEFPNVSYPDFGQGTTAALSFGKPVSVAPFRGAPNDVSCPTTSWCMSVDRSGRAQTWNGSAWSAPVTIISVDPQDDISMGVSCPTTTFCVAAVGPRGFATWSAGSWSSPTEVRLPSEGQGWYTVSCASTTSCVGLSEGLATRFNGTSWSAPQKVLPNIFGQVSCVTSSFCMAVGQDMTGAGFVTRWNGSSWSAAAKIAGAGTSIYGISCTSATFCMATLSTTSLRWNGTTWTSSPIAGSFSNFQGYSVSCTSPSFCMTFDPSLGVSRWNGSSWSALTSLSPTKAYGGVVECRSTSMCLIVDETGRFTRWNGSSWSSMSTFNSTSGVISSLSCPTTTSCLAGDAFGSVHRWTGSGWTHTKLGTRRQAVECAGDSWCVAAEPDLQRSRIYAGSWAGPVTMASSYAEPSCPVAGWCMTIDETGGARTWTGSAWSAPKPVFGAIGASNAHFIDCTSKTSCVGVSHNAYWSRWNGATWTTPQRISSGIDGVKTVECATPTMCLVAQGDGLTYRYTGTGWVQVPRAYEGSPQIDDLACTSANFCAAVGGGALSTFNGQTWNAITQALDLPSRRAYSIECPAVYTCVVASSDKVIRSS